MGKDYIILSLEKNYRLKEAVSLLIGIVPPSLFNTKYLRENVSTHSYCIDAIQFTCYNTIVEGRNKSCRSIMKFKLR